MGGKLIEFGHAFVIIKYSSESFLSNKDIENFGWDMYM
jgi:hypothetical protein